MKISNKYLLLLCFILISIFMFMGCKNHQEETFKIGITQIVEHESLDTVRQGFIDELKDLGYEEGKNIRFDFHNAGGDLSNCESIAQKFANDRPNLILAISTPSAQAVANAIKEIPILVTAITNPEKSNLVESNQKPNTNVTGTSDLSPVEKTIELITELKPSVKKIGILHSNIDVSPSYQAEIASEKIKGLCLEPRIATVSQASEVKQVTEKLISECDAIYVPMDKITAASMPLISKIALDNNKFVVCSENLVDKGAVASYGIDYYELGKLTAKQATEILENKNRPQNMPIEYLNENKLILNKSYIEKLNLEVPDKLLKIAEII